MSQTPILGHLPPYTTEEVCCVNKLRKCHARIPGADLLDGMIKEVGKSAFCVYTILKLHANWITQDSYPTQETITRLTGMDHKTIRKAMTRLVETGYIIDLDYRRAVDTHGKEYGRVRYFYKLKK